MSESTACRLVNAIDDALNEQKKYLKFKNIYVSLTLTFIDVKMTKSDSVESHSVISIVTVEIINDNQCDFVRPT